MYNKKNYFNYSKKKTTAKETFQKIVNNLQEIVDNGDYVKFLKFQNKLKNDYSFNNLILIFSQFPEATQVAGKITWKKLGRELNDDAQKISIVAPIPKSYQKKTKKIVNGDEIEEVETINYNSYRSVYVYDISQTTGDTIPLEPTNLKGNDMAYFYEDLKAFSPIPVIEKELSGSNKGYFSPKKDYIAIKNTLSTNDKASVLLHELTHKLYDDFNYSSDRNLSEVFVESVACIVADHFGLDTSMYSFNYIAQWANGDSKTVLDLGSKIQKCANKFIKELESFETAEVGLAA